MSYVIFWLQNGTSHHQPFTDLQMTEALAFAHRQRNQSGTSHVVMSSELPNQVGQKGVDSIVDGKLPDGTAYGWKKRRV